jgi:hypothetical protein
MQGTWKNCTWRGLRLPALKLPQWVSLVGPRGTRIFRDAPSGVAEIFHIARLDELEIHRGYLELIRSTLVNTKKDCCCLAINYFFDKSTAKN